MRGRKGTELIHGDSYTIKQAVYRNKMLYSRKNIEEKGNRKEKVK